MAVKLISRVKHNGVRYQAGDVIGDNDITEKQEDQLIDAGVARRTRGATQGGEKVEREESKTKQRIGSKTADRKTVSEKAQARNQRKAAAKGTKVPQTKPAEVDGDVPPASTEVDESGQDTENDTDTTQGNDGSDSQPQDGEVSFKVGDDEYTAKPTKNGQVQYRQNGGMIAKVDFMAAAQEAGVKVEG